MYFPEFFVGTLLLPTLVISRSARWLWTTAARTDAVTVGTNIDFINQSSSCDPYFLVSSFEKNSFYGNGKTLKGIYWNNDSGGDLLVQVVVHLWDVIKCSAIKSDRNSTNEQYPFECVSINLFFTGFNMFRKPKPVFSSLEWQILSLYL